MIRKTAGGEDPHRIVTGKKSSPTNNLLALGCRAAEHLYLCANPSCVAFSALQPHGDARSRTVVAIYFSRRFKLVDDNIQIAIIVQISQRHPLRHTQTVEAPLGAYLFE